MSPEVKRRSRAESQEATREALLHAAMEAFIERGIDATSIEEVTRRAGYTRGAFYSNFDSKDDLILETSRLFLDEGDAAARRLQGLREYLRNSASLFLAELVLYAVRHPQLVEPVGELHRKQLPGAVLFAETLLDRAGVARDAVDTRTLANITQCLTFALHLFELVDPEVEAEASMGVAMDLMIRGLAAGGAPRTSGARRRGSR